MSDDRKPTSTPHSAGVPRNDTAGSGTPGPVLNPVTPGAGASSFFATLVERVMPSAPPVLPRRPARFEGLGTIGDLEPIELPHFVRAEPSHTPAARAIEHSERAPDASRTIQPEPFIESTSRVHEQRVIAQFEERATETRSTSAPSIEPGAPPRVIERVRDDERATSRRTNEATILPAIETRERTVVHETLIPERRAETRRADPRERVSPIAPSTIVPQMQRVQATPVSPSSVADERRSVPAQPVAPRIEITVGTVEVRALVSPASPPPQPVRVSREPSPTTSLDDYLKNRSGGRR